MLPAGFSSPALLKFHKERTYNLNLLNVVNEFVNNKETEPSLFGDFTGSFKDFQLYFLMLKAFSPKAFS